MDKFRLFCEKANLLDITIYDQIIQYVSFDIEKGINSNKHTIIITLNKIIPIALFKNLYKDIQRHKRQLNFKIICNIQEYDSKEVDNYIKFFFELNQINDYVINTLINRENFLSVDDEGIIIINYLNKIETNEFKIYEKKLIEWFTNIGIKIKTIDYILDQSHRNIKALKNDIEKQITSSNLKYSQNEIDSKKVRSHNSSCIKAKKMNLEDITIDLLEEDKFVNCTVEGEIFQVEKTKRNNSLGNNKYEFYITDHKDTLYFKASDGFKPSKFRNGRDKNLPSWFLDEFKVGDWIRTELLLTKDEKSPQFPSAFLQFITKITKPQNFIRIDNAKEHRIELLAHTNMSTLDGLVSPTKLVDRSIQYQWQGIGIADRFNVHAYPEIYQVSKNKQKIAYGVECNIIPNKIQIVKNSKDVNLNDAEYVIFDIETTGLFNDFDEITEFGAIKIKNGVVVEKVDWFSKINQTLSQKIKEKTHITDQMLQNQPTIKETLKKIVDFVGDCILIGHNAINFDIRFINKKLIQNNMPILTNTVIDTLQLSYAINTHLTRHNLGAISRDYKILYNDAIAHRADADALILYDVWQVMLNKLKILNITNINELNNKLQNDSLHYNQFGNFQVIYAKNQKGIKDIYRLVSSSHTKNLQKRPRVYFNDINNDKNDIIVVNHPTESDLWDIAINGSDDQLVKCMSQYDFIYVSPISTLQHLINRQDIKENDIKKTIVKIIETASNLKKEVIAVSDAYYLDPNDMIAHKVFIFNKQLGGARHRLYSHHENNDVLPDLHLRTTEEMLQEFSFLKDELLIKKIVIDNPKKLINLIDSNIQPVKSGSYRPKIENVSNKLTEVVYKKAKELYGNHIPELIKTRIDHELSMIIKNDYSIIYWICYELVKKSYEDGYMVGSRGSVGSSIVAFLSGISEVNPLPPHYICKKCQYIDFNSTSNIEDGFDLPPKKCPNCAEPLCGDGHNIPFETFLGFEDDPKVPDIDLNFSGDYQPIAHQFIKNWFGSDHTFRSGTITTVADKTAYGYVKNFFEITKPNDIIKPSTIKYIANKCIDVKRTTGQHPGGIIIVPKEYDMLDFSPFNYPADDKELNWYTTHFDFSSMHDNLLKFDILGHDDPTMMKMMEEITGIDPRIIPFHDDEVIKLYTSLESLHLKPEQLLGETVGSFGLPEFGTSFARKLLTVSKPQSFADLVHVAGLSHGTNVWQDNAEDLIKKQGFKLNEIITCRDGIMLYLISKGIDKIEAFKIMEFIRKNKNSKPLPEKWEKLMQDHDVPQWYINSCKKIQYLFPKAHATAYVIMSWRTGWFKIHHPLAFYAAYFSIRPDVFDIKTILKGSNEIRNRLLDIKNRLNNNITKFDVKKKDKDLIPIYELALEMYERGYSFNNVNLEQSDATKFKTINKSLIPPFSCIDGLGKAVADSIVDARNKQFFMSREDLIERTKVSKAHLEQFDALGVLDSLDIDNQMSLF